MLASGTILEGRYELGAPLGEGGMAIVYAARHLVLDLPVAIKVLDPILARDASTRRRFLEEARTLARFQHRGVVRVADTVVDTDQGVAGFVMELLPGRTLSKELELHGQLDGPRAVSLIAELLDALHYCHRRGVIHRDIKPSNVFVCADDDTDWRIKLMDFGIARIEGSRKTSTGATLGTSGYMSPEQIISPRDVDPRSDLFSVGTLLYEVVTGTQPFECDTDFATAQRIVQTEYVDPRQRGRRLPEGLAASIDRALQKDPGARYATAAQMADALRQSASSSEMPFLRPDVVLPSGAGRGIDRGWLMAQVDTFLRPLGDGRVYIAPDIPPDKLRKARNGILGTLGPSEEVLVLYDDTLFGGCKDGFALTPTRFLYKDLWEDAGAFPYNGIGSLEVVSDAAGCKVHIGGVSTAAMTVCDDKEALANALVELLRHAADRAR